MHNDINELVMIGAIFIIVIFTAYKFIRALYLNSRYKVCPKCGCKTIQTQETEYTYADQETYEVIKCTNFEQKCGWKYKFKY